MRRVLCLAAFAAVGFLSALSTSALAAEEAAAGPVLVGVGSLVVAADPALEAAVVASASLVDLATADVARAGPTEQPAGLVIVAAPEERRGSLGALRRPAREARVRGGGSPPAGSLSATWSHRAEPWALC